ncbi:hypothetical protein GE061_005185 [Apolygus lucorum]|uniref:Uncharacterized protein n=1 Tax=Apolygus lucorum TaxID=248454 RepID=A0A8S9WUY8_APOLU|nr:hypothetical protein GE061_005185 [Apolygus lucorum]
MLNAKLVLDFKLSWEKINMIWIKTLVLLAASFQPAPTKADDTCFLDNRAIYSYVVKIWNTRSQAMYGHGAILSVFSIVTGCTNFRFADPNNHLDDFEITGVRVQDVKPTLKVCGQTRKVTYYAPHPKCVAPYEQVFNAALFVLKDPFNVKGSYSYPTLPVLSAPFHLTQDVLFIDQVRDTGCELVLFYYLDKKDPLFDIKWQVTSIPFKSECIGLFCQYDPDDPPKTKACKARYGNRVNGTQLCMKPKSGPIIPGMANYLKTNINPYCGGILACNGSAVGMTTQVKWRTTYSGKDTKREDFFYVMTFARVYLWLFENKVRYGANWLHPYFLESAGLKKEEVSSTSKKPKPEPTLYPTYQEKAIQFVSRKP